MATEFDHKLKTYLEACKRSMRYAKLSNFINSHTPLAFEFKPDIMDPQDLKSRFKRAFNAAANRDMKNSCFAADVDSIDWVKFVKEKATHWKSSGSSSASDADAEPTLITTVIDTSLMEPIKEYVKDKKKGLNPAVPRALNVPAGSGYQQFLFNYCLGFIKQDKLLKTVDGPLQLGLSGIINTISTDKTFGIKDYIGKNSFEYLENLLKKEGFNKEYIGDPESDATVKSILTKYEDGGIIGARCYIFKKKLELLEGDKYTAESTPLKMYDIFGYLFDMIQFDFDNKYKYTMTENESFARWQFILRVLFRGSIVRLRTGEVVSQATRNEMIDALAPSSSGRKIDMLVMTQSEDGEESCIELSANEHKKGNAEFDVINEQQAKNIVTNVCILSQLKKRFAVDIGIGSNTNPLVMDVIGLRAYLYSIAKTEDVFLASKISNHYVVLPTTLAELDEFIEQGSIYLLLNYAKYIITAASEIVSSTDKTLKRRFEAIMNDQVDQDSPNIFFSDNKKQK